MWNASCKKKDSAVFRFSLLVFRYIYKLLIADIIVIRGDLAVGAIRSG